MNALAKAFQGEPQTTLTEANGQTSITVAARHLRPDDAHGGDLFAACLAGGFGGLSVFYAVGAQEIWGPLLIAVTAFWSHSFMREQFREWGQATTNIRFTEDAIYFQRAPLLFEEVGWEKFDRRSPHRFVILEHERAREEKDEIEYRVRNNPKRRVARYYTDSYFVVLEYLGQRIDLVEVMGARRARAILERLVLCDEYMNGVVSARQRLPMRPEDEWSGPSSSVPQ